MSLHNFIARRLHSVAPKGTPFRSSELKAGRVMELLVKDDKSRKLFAMTYPAASVDPTIMSTNPNNLFYSQQTQVCLPKPGKEKELQQGVVSEQTHSANRRHRLYKTGINLKVEWAKLEAT